MRPRERRELQPASFMNASAAIADSLLRQACQEPMPTGGKVLIRCDLIERSGSSEAWYGGRARRSVGQRTAGSMPPSFAAPRARLATRLRDFATNRHELCGLK